MRPGPTATTAPALPPATAEPGRLRATFLGVSTILFDDGHTAVLTDGFFTRPGMFRCLTRRIAPNPTVIDRCLARAGITSLAAVVVLHSHYDHLLDAPAVTQKTGAHLVGSASTTRVGAAAGLPAERLIVPMPGQPLTYGGFTLTLVESEHVPPARFPGHIDEPLIPPARLAAYRMAECYSLLVEHHGRRILVQGSAGFRPGGLDGFPADVAYLGIGLLGKQPSAYREEYWRQTVTAVGARRVLPIHWDDFWRPLHRPLTPMPRLLDSFPATMSFLRGAAARDGVDLRMPTTWQPTDPFTGLPPG